MFLVLELVNGVLPAPENRSVEADGTLVYRSLAAQEPNLTALQRCWMLVRCMAILTG